MRDFVLILVWFLFRRWHLQLLCRDYGETAKRKLFYNMKSTGMGGCRNSIISKDLKKLLGVEDIK